MSNLESIHPEIEKRLGRQELAVYTPIGERLTAIFDYIDELSNCVLLMAKKIDELQEMIKTKK